jgi:hypothetical protein
VIKKFFFVYVVFFVNLYESPDSFTKARVVPHPDKADTGGEDAVSILFDY